MEGGTVVRGGASGRALSVCGAGNGAICGEG